MNWNVYPVANASNTLCFHQYVQTVHAKINYESTLFCGLHCFILKLNTRKIIQNWVDCDEDAVQCTCIQSIHFAEVSKPIYRCEKRSTQIIRVTHIRIACEWKKNHVWRHELFKAMIRRGSFKLNVFVDIIFRSHFALSLIVTVYKCADAAKIFFFLANLGRIRHTYLSYDYVSIFFRLQLLPTRQNNKFTLSFYREQSISFELTLLNRIDVGVKWRVVTTH